MALIKIETWWVGGGGGGGKRESFKKEIKCDVYLQHCWKHYITHYHTEPFFPVSALFLNPNSTGGTLKFLNSI
jgi:hypothetical protein